MGKFCQDCGEPDCKRHPPANGNGIRQEIRHQDELGKVAHEKLEGEIKRIEKESQYRYEKNEKSIKEIQAHLDSKFKFAMTFMIAILGTLGTVVLAGDNTINDDLDQIEALLYENIKINQQTAALQDAIAAGHVRIASEVAAEERILERLPP